MSHFSWLVDGSIVGLYLAVTMTAGVLVRRYVGKVEHFLVAGREMNVFLGIASLAATEFGIVTCMYTAQAGYEHGFSGATPGILQALAMLIIGITGFCVKPLRDSGVMTIPELFEQRFGKFVRWLSGVVIVLGGLLNMGVFLQNRWRVSGPGDRNESGLPGHDHDAAVDHGRRIYHPGRNAVRAGDRLSAVHCDEFRAAGGDVSDPGQGRLDHDREYR